MMRYMMPTMREVQIVVRDDLDGSVIGYDTEPTRFGWDGVAYEIDLTGDHRNQLAELLRPYLEVARPDKDQVSRSHGAGGSSRRTRELARVREWAKANDLGEWRTGRVPIDVHEAYNRAHPNNPIPMAASYGGGKKKEK